MKTVNSYININRIEFIVTYQCSGKCRHCSVGPKLNGKGRKAVDADKAVAAVKQAAEVYPIESVMTFGGEPLLYADVTCAIHRQAKQSGVKKRQIITNGYFTKDTGRIEETGRGMANAGISDVLLSVDAFHQETIPLETVHTFADALVQNGLHVRLHPAWVVSREDDNRHNRATREILESFSDLDIPVSEGNVIFPAGNAAIHLREFYPLPETLDLSATCGTAPYTDPLTDIRSISIEPNGNVQVCAFVIGNISHENILDILNRYDPFQNSQMAVLMEHGVAGLLNEAESRGQNVDRSDCYSACSVCRKITAG